MATEASRTQTLPSACNMCSRNCPLEVDVQDGRIIAVRGAVCPRGRANLDFLYHPERILTPLRRTGPRGRGQFEPVSWEQALTGIAERLTALRLQYGPESVAFYSGYTKEARPWLKRLAMAFGTPNYLTESSCCYYATSMAAQLNFGSVKFGVHDTGPHPKTKSLVVWATDPDRSLIPTSKHIHAAKRGGLKLVVIDCRRTPMARRADLALHPRPGTDGALALAVARTLIVNEWYDKEFVARFLHGWDEYRHWLLGLSPDYLSSECGVPQESIEALAGVFWGDRPTKIQTSVATLAHHVGGVQTFRAVSLISALTDNLDVEGGNLLWPGGVRLSPITLDDRLASMPPRVGADRFPVWCELFPEGQAMALPKQILSSSPYPIKAFYGLGANYMMWPQSHRTAEALSGLDLVVTADFFHTPTTALADYVLPACTHFEREGLIVRDDGLVRLRRPVIPPLGESRPDWWILFTLAEKLGLGDLFWNGSFRKALDEWLAPSGTTYQELVRNPEGVRCPVPPNTGRKYLKQGFGTPTGKVEAYSTILARHGYDPLPVYVRPPYAALADRQPDLPLILLTGARQPCYTHSQHRNISRLRRQMPEPLVSVNPSDAVTTGLADGGLARITSLQGSVVMRVQVTDEVPPGLVSAPYGWAKADINTVLDGELLDPISGYPCFKGQPCKLEPAEGAIGHG